MQGIAVTVLGPGDLPRLLAVRAGLFDQAIDPAQSGAFLADPMNVIVLAHAGDHAVGMATGTVLLHPDKPPNLLVHELGTRDGWTRRGIATAMMQARRTAGAARGAQGMWLATETDNDAARGLYRRLGAAETMVACYVWDDDDIHV